MCQISALSAFFDLPEQYQIKKYQIIKEQIIKEQSDD